MAVELKPVLRYPGSKARIAGWIVEHFPKHEAYCEPFFGGGSVLFAKPRADLELVNDIDGRVVNLFRVLRDRPQELADAVALTPWARDEFEVSREDGGGDLERARRFIVYCWQAYSSGAGSGWMSEISDLRANGKRHPALKTRVWMNLPERLAAVVDRLQGVQIENQSATELIRRCSSREVLLYCDPPYLIETRTGKTYSHEMTTADHEALLAAIREHPGPVVLSGYPNTLYDEELVGWHRVAIDALALDAARRKECLWLNPAASYGRAQASFDLT